MFLANIFSGACVGRFYADLLECPQPGAVAVCGAAACLASYFRYPLTVSVLVMELTSDVFLSLPLMGGIVISKVIADKLSPTVLEVMTAAKGYPILAHTTERSRAAVAGRTAGDCADRSVATVKEGATVQAIRETLSVAVSQDYFPVLDSSGRVVGGFGRKSCQLALESGVWPAFEERDACVDELTPVMRCYRLVRDNGMKRVVVTSHIDKTFIGILARNSLSRIVNTL
jgi:Voltage gated chloride channel